jgi:two-component system response regulator YesN
MRVLIVDDEGVVRDVLATILADNGFDVMTAGSGPQGLDILARTPADFIITDLLMPHMSGTELLKEAKRLNPDIKVILMSGHVDFDRPTAESISEAYATLQKPFDFRKLMDLLTAAQA